MAGFAKKIMGVVCGAALMASTSASAAVTTAQSPNYSPWAALSAFASSSSAQALCSTAVAGTASTAGQAAPAPGCVLPAVDAPAPVPVETAAAPVVTSQGGFPVLGLLAGLAALAAFTALVLSDNDEGEDEISVSP